MNKSIMVTGASGFVGSHLVRALLERGCAVVALDLAPALPQFVTEGIEDARLTYRVSDVADSHQFVEAVVGHGVEDVVHTAAALAEPESLLRPRHFLRVNAESVWQMCDVARSLPIRRLLAVSTRSVYGAYSPEDGPVTEDATPRPVAFYGASKAAADVVAIQYRRHFGLDVVIPRITGAYGPHQRYPQVLSEMVDAVMREKAFVRPTGGDFMFEFTYVKDIVRGLLDLLDAKSLKHPVYNVGGGKQHSLTELAETVRRVVPESWIEIGTGTDPTMAPRAPMSVQRLVDETGFRPGWTLEQGIREFVEWHRTGSYGRAVEKPPTSESES